MAGSLELVQGFLNGFMPVHHGTCDMGTNGRRCGTELLERKFNANRMNQLGTCVEAECALRASEFVEFFVVQRRELTEDLALRDVPELDVVAAGGQPFAVA